MKYWRGQECSLLSAYPQKGKYHQTALEMSCQDHPTCMGVFDQDQTNHHQGNHPDWAPQAPCPGPPPHLWAVLSNVYLFLCNHRGKRRVITWLYTVMMHKLHLTPSLECVDWRTNSYDQIWTNPGGLILALMPIWGG